MADVVVSRKFRLRNLNLAQEFDIFRDTVNDQIRQGLQLPSSQFENKSLISVKKFYKNISNPVNTLKERAHRCAAQYSYFSVKQYRENQEQLKQIIDLMLKKGFFSDIHRTVLLSTDLSYYEIENRIKFIQNLLLGGQQIDLSIFHNDLSEEMNYRKVVQHKLSDNKYMKLILKSFKYRVITRLNRRFKELRSTSYKANSNYDQTILSMLNLARLADVSNISDNEWKQAKKSWRQSIDNLNISQLIKINWGIYSDSKLVLRRLIKGGKTRLWINGGSTIDLLDFVKQHLDELLIEQMIVFYRGQFLVEINQFLNTLRTDLNQQVPDILKVPEFSKSSIPLGIDDGQVYNLEEKMVNGDLYAVNIRVSLMPRNFQNTQIINIDRYRLMINNGFTAQRGVLSFSHGKYFIHIPFTKKASKKRDNDVIASADLGLKTFATLSVFDKRKEIDRQFLDQKQLGGPKSTWWTQAKTMNIKGRLLEHRYVARRQQSVRMQSNRGSVKHWFARNIEKNKWRKIKRTHMELVNQISTRIIAYLNYFDVSRLVLEDLRWSKHSLKTEVGYFLSSWQIHWFFAQIQDSLKNMALLHGITVELVDPKYSSKNCWKCNQRGSREAKTFICTSNSCVKYQVDSDLNAARNLAKRSKIWLTNP
jgi:IS605 OrfB family transposase